MQLSKTSLNKIPKSPTNRASATDAKEDVRLDNDDPRVLAIKELTSQDSFMRTFDNFPQGCLTPVYDDDSVRRRLIDY
jgi:hypothetical protein